MNPDFKVAAGRYTTTSPVHPKYVSQEERRPSREASWAVSGLWPSMVSASIWRRGPRWRREWAPAVPATAPDPAASATTEGGAWRKATATSVTAHSLPTEEPPATKVSPWKQPCRLCNSFNWMMLILTNRWSITVEVIPLQGTNSKCK